MKENPCGRKDEKAQPCFADSTPVQIMEREGGKWAEGV